MCTLGSSCWIPAAYVGDLGLFLAPGVGLISHLLSPCWVFVGIWGVNQSIHDQNFSILKIIVLFISVFLLERYLFLSYSLRSKHECPRPELILMWGTGAVTWGSTCYVMVLPMCFILIPASHYFVFCVWFFSTNVFNSYLFTLNK